MRMEGQWGGRERGNGGQEKQDVYHKNDNEATEEKEERKKGEEKERGR